MQNLTGKTIDRYHILEQIGEGGMAVVYKAYDTRLHTEVAFKIIQTDAFPAQSLDRMLARFKRETQTLAKLQHSNIVGIIDYGEYEQTPYLVMEYLPGGSLKQILGKALPFKEAASLLLPIADALAHAHKQGIIHRDIKPSNILFSVSRDPMLTDFGIAKLIEDADELHTLTGTGVGIGTPEYMAPEQGLGKPIDGRADIYSLGIIFYELITGQKPYSAETPMAVILKHMTDPLPNPSEMVSGLPPQVVKVLLKALAKNPRNRYKNMVDFTKALRSLLIVPIVDSTQLKNNEKQLKSKNNKLEKKSDKRKILIASSITISILLVGFYSIIQNKYFPSGLNRKLYVENMDTLITSVPSTTPTGTPQSTKIPPTNTPASSTATIQPTPSMTSTFLNNELKQIDVNNIIYFSPKVLIPSRYYDDPKVNWESEIDFSPDSKYIARAVGSEVSIYSTETGYLAVNPMYAESTIASMEFSIDGNQIAVGLVNNNIQIWDTSSGNLVYVLKGHNGTVETISFSPDGKYLSSGSKDKTVKQWDLETGILYNTIKSIGAQVTSIDYSPDGFSLAIGTAIGRIYLYQLSDKELVGLNGPVTSLNFSSDSKYLVSAAQRTTILWDVENGTMVQKLVAPNEDSGQVTVTTISTDNSIIASSINGSIFFWNAINGLLLHTIEFTDSWDLQISLSSNQQYLAVEGYVSPDGWDYGLALYSLGYIVNPHPPKTFSGYLSDNIDNIMCNTQVSDPIDGFLPNYSDIVSVSVVCDNRKLEVIITLHDLPEKMIFNNLEIPVEQNEYAWAVEINRDGNLETGGFPHYGYKEGIDYTLAAVHNKTNKMPTEDWISENLEIELLKNSDNLIVNSTSFKTYTNINDNTITLSGTLPLSLSDKSVLFVTSRSPDIQ